MAYSTNWHANATVRTAPQRILDDEEIKDKLYFSPDIVPLYNHPLLVKRDTILVYYLCYSLSVTEGLEHQIVNKVIENLIEGEYNFSLEESIYEEARKIYVDEAYHSLFSADLLSQVLIKTGISFESPFESRYTKAIEEIKDEISESSKKYVSLIFSIVSETLITGVLSKIPKDKRVIQTIREVYRDHALDEARHHDFFSRLLKIIWPQLSIHNQKELTPLFLKFIEVFVEPDYSIIKNWLNAIGLDNQTASTIIDESYNENYTRENLKNVSKNLIKYLHTLGILN